MASKTEWNSYLNYDKFQTTANMKNEKNESNLLNYNQNVDAQRLEISKGFERGAELYV